MAEATQEILTDEAWNEIVDTIAEVGIEKLDQNVLSQMDYSLKQAARDFNQVYDTAYQTVKDIRKKLSDQQTIRHKYEGYSGVQSITNPEDLLEYNRNKQEISNQINNIMPQIYSAVFRFQEILNYYLGQRIRIIVVYKDGTLFEGTTEQAEKLLRYDYNGTQLTARYNTSKAQLESALEALNLQDYCSQAKLPRIQHGYESAIWRWNYSRKPNNNLTKNGGGGLVMWRNPDNLSRWIGMTVSAQGDISEAYATILLSRQIGQPESKYFNSDMIEDILNDFMPFVGNVDPTSGMLQGDTSVGNIEYAIKAMDNSAIGWVQFHRIANMILKRKFTRQKLVDEKNRLAEKGRNAKRNKMTGDITDQVNQSIEDAITKKEIELTLKYTPSFFV